MESEYKDLGKGTMVENWPDWLRWLLFIPASIVVPFLVFLFYYLIQTWFLDLGENAFYINFLRGVIYGSGFVLVGATVAPKGQKIVAIIFLIIIAVLAGMSILASLSNGFKFNEVAENIVTLFAAGSVTYFISNGEVK